MIRELPRDQTWLISLTVLAEMAARRGRRAACAAAYEELLPSDGLFAGSTGVLRGAAAHYLGLLAAVAGSYEAAEHHFRDAAAMHEIAGTVPYGPHRAGMGSDVARRSETSIE